MAELDEHGYQAVRVDDIGRGSQGLWEQSWHPSLSLRSFQKRSVRC
jgi:hypothetical protein